MVQARAELTAGDLRLLYLAWLLALQSGEMDDEHVEPPVRRAWRTSAQRCRRSSISLTSTRISSPWQRLRALRSRNLTAWWSGSRPFPRRRRTLCLRGSRPGKAHRSRPSCCAASARRPVHRRPGRRGTPLTCSRRRPIASTRGRRPWKNRNQAEAARRAATRLYEAPGRRRPGRRLTSGSRRGGRTTTTWPCRCWETCRRSLSGKMIRPRSGRGSASCAPQHLRKPSLLGRFDRAGLPS